MDLQLEQENDLYDIVPPEHKGDWLAVLMQERNSPEATDLGKIYADKWECKLQKKGYLDSPLVEVTPFVFKDTLYRLENWQKFWELPPYNPGERYLEDEVRIRDVEKDEIVSIPLKGYTFSSAFVWNGKIYVFAGNHNTATQWRHVTEMVMTCTEDLVNWSEPKTVLKALEGEYFFNVAVCRGKDSFVLLYETNDAAWPGFTFRYCVSDDLTNWEIISDALYGKEKYAGGPSLYYEGEYYYTLYLQDLGSAWETRITRSRDLIHWEDAPVERPFVTFDSSVKNIRMLDSEICECNASDAELCYWKGKTIVYFTGSDQQIGGDLQVAEFDGTPRELLEHYFEETKVDLPSPRQLAYQNNQLGAFVHYGPASYTGNSDMMSTPEASLFNPDQLDVEQWVMAAKSFGAKHIVLTAKHHNGFCLWPTATTDYSVKNCPWKNGNGDIVREFVDAARKHGIAPGLYFSLGDKHWGCHSTPDPMGKRKLIGNRAEFLKFVKAQLKELLTNYGPLSMAWFDGAYDPFGYDVLGSDGKCIGHQDGDKIVEQIRKLQPETIIFGSTRPDARWSGSERAWATYPLLNMISKDTVPSWIPPYIEGWCPVETCIHTRDTWFWTPDSDDTLLAVDEFWSKYYQSIGRGANLLINITPDTSGQIPQAEVARLNEFGQQLHDYLGTPIASISSKNRWSEGYTLELDIGKSSQINHIILEENIEFGQKIQNYVIESFKDGKWVNIATGLTIGRKRIEKLEDVVAEKIRLRVLRSIALPDVRLFAAFGESY